VREAGPWLSSWPSGWLWLNMWGLAGELHQSAVLASGEVRRVLALPALETVGKRNTSAAFAMQIRNLYRLLLFVPLQVMQVRKSYFVQLAIGRPIHLPNDCRSRRSATCVALLHVYANAGWPDPHELLCHQAGHIHAGPAPVSLLRLLCMPCALSELFAPCPWCCC